MLDKINHNQANGILIVPVWITQAWLSVTVRMVVASLLFPQIDNLVTLPSDKLKKHPLRNILRPMTLHLSGIHSQVRKFQAKLKKLSCLRYKYELVLRKWEKVFTKRGSDPYRTNVNNILELLTEVYEKRKI